VISTWRGKLRLRPEQAVEQSSGWLSFSPFSCVKLGKPESVPVRFKSVMMMLIDREFRGLEHGFARLTPGDLAGDLTVHLANA